MKSPKFKNGDIVYINPVSSGGLQGKILGVIHYIDGTFGYVVTHVIYGSNGGVQRTFLGEEEIHLVEED